VNPYADLAGKSVLVTGGASNIGRGIVLGFATQQARIVLVDIDADQAAKTAAEAIALGAETVVVQADLASHDDAVRAVEKAQESFGRIDVLVNNVGWQIPSWFTDIDPATVDRTLALNLVSTIDMSRAVLPVMKDQGGGSIVSISSDAAFGDVRQSVYGAAKAGVISLMKSLAKENGRFGVRCNVVAPGLVTPPGHEWIGQNSLWSSEKPVFTDSGLAAVLKGIPLGRMSTPEDIAATVLFFASDTTARQLTGQVISVSGGYAMPG
jgi:NAD(P)-dependent dehydrogenase (short-subunit alcohol dehydrogenase family)